MKNIKTGVKLTLGFLLVVILLGGVAGYQILSMYDMKEMQDEGAGRATDSIAVHDVQIELGNVYGVFADGMINRDLDETREGLKLLKENAQRDIKLVHELVDTDAERARAKEFEAQYLLYIDGFENGVLPILAKEESLERRMNDSLAIMRIALSIGEVYPVIADAVINRNLEETAANWKEIRAVAAKDIVAVMDLSDTGEEKALAREFGQAYEEYMGLFENDMLPLLTGAETDWYDVRGVDGEIDGVRDRVLDSLEKINRSLEQETLVVIADEQRIRALDGEIDAFRNKAGHDLEAIVASLKEESEEADAVFDSITDRTVNIAAVCIAVGVLLSLGIAFLLTRSITGPLGRASAFAQAVAGGNLDTNLDVHQQDEVGVLAEAMRTMVDNLKEKIAQATKATEEAAEEAEKAKIATGEAEEAKSEGMNAAAEQISGIVERVTSAAEELSAQVEQSSRGAETQRERAGETATAMEEMNATVLEVAKNASSAAENATNAKGKAEEGTEVVKQVVGAINKVQDQALVLKDNMTELGTQADGIGQIMNVISDIADQTNLLALNAAIEAARAGDAGRGFAVVADEVRKLAEKTMAATKEVGSSIQAIQDGTRKNIGETDKAVEVVGEILKLSETNADQVRSIATGAEEQSAASEQINRGAEEINRISSETAEAMNQSARAVSELSELSQELQRIVEEMRQA